MGQIAAGGSAAAAQQSMALILADEGPDFGQFPDLVPQRLSIGTDQGARDNGGSCWEYRG